MPLVHSSRHPVTLCNENEEPPSQRHVMLAILDPLLYTQTSTYTYLMEMTLGRLNLIDILQETCVFATQ